MVTLNSNTVTHDSVQKIMYTSLYVIVLILFCSVCCLRLNFTPDTLIKSSQWNTTHFPELS